MRGAPAAPRPTEDSPRQRRRKEASFRASPVARPEKRSPRPPLGQLGHRVADAYLWMAALAVVELGVVGIAERRELTAPIELSTAAKAMLPIAIAAMGPVAILFGGVLEAVRASNRPGGRWVTMGFAGIAGAAVAFGVSTGRHLAGTIRPVFVVGFGVLVATIAAFAAPPLASWLDRAAPKPRALWVFATAAALAVACEMANLDVLPRLYPAFHWTLLLVTLFAAASVTLAYELAPTATVSKPRWQRPFAAIVLFAVTASLSKGAATRLALADNIRLIFSSHAPILGRAVELGAAAIPPAPLDPEAPSLTAEETQSVDLTGWDVLLISVDAMRADHLGAYGYERSTSPNIDQIAKDGVVFEDAYTTTPHTSYAVTSLMTGKYMRPLILQGLGGDSETWADHLRRYGYKTAAFYPPAVFFIDGDKFAHFHESGFGFEYRKEEFATPDVRVNQIREYLVNDKSSARRFLWVHLFEPHEPYEAHPAHPFGDRDVDRYDSEIAEADSGVGAIVHDVLAARPKTIVILTADHGEEFGDHGGHYHGTTVYEEQVRVPLVVMAKGLFTPRRVENPVGLVDLLPTILRGLSIPRPARLRGRDIGPLLVGNAGGTTAEPDAGLAFAETDTMTMLAEGPFRLVCMRRVGACTLYNARKDPGETRDVSGNHPEVVSRMRAALERLEASHGKYELRGLRAEGKGWPEVLRRGIAGDGDAAPDIVPLLDDADVTIRRKSAEVLFDLKRSEASAGLKLALGRDEDPEVKAWASLALTRLGEGAPLIYELLTGKDLRFRRLASLALAEGGDDRGADELVAWWRAAFPHDRAQHRPEPLDFERAKEILAAFNRLKPKTALIPLIESLGDVRLRPFIAETLAFLGDDAARAPLADQLLIERYQTARVAIAEALLKLGAGPELLAPLTSLLGMPDPLPGGLGMAMRAALLPHVGGPVRQAELKRMQHFATSGVAVDFFVPKVAVDRGVRIICRAKSRGPGEIRVGRRLGLHSGSEKKAPIPNEAPPLDPARSLTLPVGSSEEIVEVFATLPETLDVHPGKQATLVFYGTQPVTLEACALVPLRDELPPPPKEPWKPVEGEGPTGE